MQFPAQLLRGDAHAVAAVLTAVLEAVPRSPAPVTMAPEAWIMISEDAMIVGDATAIVLILLALVLTLLLAATVAAGLPAVALFERLF